MIDDKHGADGHTQPVVARRGRRVAAADRHAPCGTLLCTPAPDETSASPGTIPRKPPPPRWPAKSSAAPKAGAQQAATTGAAAAPALSPEQIAEGKKQARQFRPHRLVPGLHGHHDRLLHHGQQTNRDAGPDVCRFPADSLARRSATCSARNRGAPDGLASDLAPAMAPADRGHRHPRRRGATCTRTMLPCFRSSTHTSTFGTWTSFTLPWLAGKPELRRSYRMPDYLAATAGLNIIQAVYMEVDVDPAQQQARGRPFDCALPRGQASHTGRRDLGPPRQRGIRFLHQAARLESLYQRRAPGVARRLDAAGLLPARRLCARRPDCWAPLACAMTFVSARPSSPTASSWSISAPDTRFVLDHCGNIDPKTFAAGAGEAAVSLPRAMAARHRRAGPTKERRLQGLRHRRQRGTGQMASRGSGAADQPLPRRLRTQAGDVRQRLARLHPCRDTRPMGRRAETDRHLPPLPRTARSVP